ncbi:hypothetical protein [Bdellovibrio sp. HCB2-146]|uniref:hypothetical protein n=1 Tax=Bdellovibrio sp. HCB2-146 TaxID=3394362 RepID=UPI0039BD1E50
MESVAPPLALLLCVKRAIEKGQPVRVGILYYLKRHEGDFPEFVMRWMGLLQQGQDATTYLETEKSMHRRILIQLLERGLRGEAIYPTLLQLESEIIEACQDELGTKLARLPFILLIPLLLFQFPAFLMLLFGPLLKNFFHSFGGG